MGWIRGGAYLAWVSMQGLKGMSEGEDIPAKRKVEKGFLQEGRAWTKRKNQDAKGMPATSPPQAFTATSTGRDRELDR